MLFNVPQFIDIEDKIVGPLTAKQLGWFALGGVILLVLYRFLDSSAFIIAGIIVGIITGTLGFYRPYNQPFISFIFSSVHFLLKPRLYVWRRAPDMDNLKAIQSKAFNKKIPSSSQKKNGNKRNIEEISKLLDYGNKY